jgi:hypothetical protein
VRQLADALALAVVLAAGAFWFSFGKATYC